MKTDPHRGGHERFRVSKKNLEDKLPNPSNECDSPNTHNTAISIPPKSWDDYDDWYGEGRI